MAGTMMGKQTFTTVFVNEVSRFQITTQLPTHEKTSARLFSGIGIFL